MGSCKEVFASQSGWGRVGFGSVQNSHIGVCILLAPIPGPAAGRICQCCSLCITVMSIRLSETREISDEIF